MQKKLWLWIGIPGGLVALFAFWVLSEKSAGDQGPPLSLLMGLKPDLSRRQKSNAFGLDVYYIKADYNQVITQARNELSGWDEHSNLDGGRRWREIPGPFINHGRQVAIRPNRIDPDSWKPLGPASDSKTWVTIRVFGGLPDDNVARGIGRLLTGNKNR